MATSRARYTISLAHFDQNQFIESEYLLATEHRAKKTVQCKLLVRFMGKLNDITLEIPTFSPHTHGSIILINTLFYSFVFLNLFSQSFFLGMAN